MSDMQFAYRPPLIRELTHYAPYVTLKNKKAPVNAASRNPVRWANSLKCNRHASSTTVQAKKDCAKCTAKMPFFWKDANFLHPQGTKYEDILFPGDYEIDAAHGCMDPRDAHFQSHVKVHCQEMCAGKKDKKKCCLSLDLSVLDWNDCPEEQHAMMAAAAAASAAPAATSTK